MPRMPDVMDLGAPRIPTGSAADFVDKSASIAAAGAIRTAASIGTSIQEFAESWNAVEAQRIATDIRSSWAAKYQQHQAKAANDGSGFTASVLADYDDDVRKALDGAPAGVRNSLTPVLGNFRVDIAGRAGAFQMETGIRNRERTLERSIDQLATAAELDPQAMNGLVLQREAIDDSALPPETRARLHERADNVALHGGIGFAKRDAKGVLDALAAGDKASPLFANMANDQRHQLEQFARGQLVEQSAAKIMRAYEQSTDAGRAAVAALRDSPLPADLLEGIRSNVNQRVSQLRGERRQEMTDDLVAVERAIATDTTTPATERTVKRLYAMGALSPEEYAHSLARIDASVLQRAKANAGAASIREALVAGLPLDPKDSDQRKALDAYFISGTAGVPVGSEPWTSAAIVTANKTRMLPDSALAWTRQALRSPDPKIAANAAQFYGAVRAAAPDAVSELDTDTRSFASMVNGMIEVGADPRAAVETARANVFDVRPETIKNREHAWSSAGKGSLQRSQGSALQNLIDRDFDAGITEAEPAAGDERLARVAGARTLAPDFDAQTRAYFLKTGDIDQARKLAWEDVTRIYGPSRVNGEPAMQAFPVERFGIKPEDVRTDIATFLKANPQPGGVRPEDIVVVPDAVTLRQVGDALTGQRIAPSYALANGVTGDLVLNDQGVPQRYTIPTGDELTRRIRASQEKAAEEARKQIAEARERREAEQRMNQFMLDHMVK